MPIHSEELPPDIFEHLREAPKVFRWLWISSTISTLIVLLVSLKHVAAIVNVARQVRRAEQRVFLPILAGVYLKIFLFFPLISFLSWTSLILIRFALMFQLLLHLYEVGCLLWFWDLMTDFLNGPEEACTILRLATSLVPAAVRQLETAACRVAKDEGMQSTELSTKDSFSQRRSREHSEHAEKDFEAPASDEVNESNYNVNNCQHASSIESASERIATYRQRTSQNRKKKFKKLAFGEGATQVGATQTTATISSAMSLESTQEPSFITVASENGEQTEKWNTPVHVKQINSDRKKYLNSSRQRPLSAPASSYSVTPVVRRLHTSIALTSIKMRGFPLSTTQTPIGRHTPLVTNSSSLQHNTIDVGKKTDEFKGGDLQEIQWAYPESPIRGSEGRLKRIRSYSPPDTRHRKVDNNLFLPSVKPPYFPQLDLSLHSHLPTITLPSVTSDELHEWSIYLQNVQLGPYMVLSMWPFCWVPWFNRIRSFNESDLWVSHTLVAQYGIFAILAVLSRVISQQFFLFFQILSFCSLVVGMYGLLILYRATTKIVPREECQLGSELLLRYTPIIQEKEAPYIKTIMTHAWIDIVVNLSSLPLTIMAAFAYSADDISRRYSHFHVCRSAMLITLLTDLTSESKHNLWCPPLCCKGMAGTQSDMVEEVVLRIRECTPTGDRTRIETPKSRTPIGHFTRKTIM